MEIAELNAPHPRSGDTRLAAATTGARRPTGRRLILATTDPDQARRQQADFRRRMNAADKTPDGRAVALRQAYNLDGWLPQSATDNILKIDYNAASGRVALRLRDGTQIVDDGSRVAITRGQLTDSAADEMLAAVQRRGWREVELTGDDQFKNAMALRFALAEPPVRVTGHTLPPELQQRLESELATRRPAADRQQQPTAAPAKEQALAPPPPRAEAAAAAWLRGRADERRRTAAGLDSEIRRALDHGARFDRPAHDALYAHVDAERALTTHRSTSRPDGILARLTGQAEAWDAEEQRLDRAREAAETELERQREQKRQAQERAADQARPLEQQAEQHRQQAAALERVARAAQRGDPRAHAVAARQDDGAALRLAEQLRQEAEAAERRRRAEQAAELARQQQQDNAPTRRYGRR